MVPKSHVHKRLKQAGRIVKLKLMRCMTVTQVREALCDAFSGFDNVETSQFLRCGKDNVMLLNEDQELNGDGIINLAGQGSLYLVQKKVSVSIIVITIIIIDKRFSKFLLFDRVNHA